VPQVFDILTIKHVTNGYPVRHNYKTSPGLNLAESVKGHNFIPVTDAIVPDYANIATNKINQSIEKQNIESTCQNQKQVIYMTKRMIKGVLKTWKEDRGFGFIKPDAGGRDIFIHISALKEVSRRPITGDVIFYQITKDNRGKYKAINAHIEGAGLLENVSEDFLNTDSSKKGVIAITVGLLVIIAIAGFIYIRWAH
jgi:CspA family cold shock protein